MNLEIEVGLWTPYLIRAEMSASLKIVQSGLLTVLRDPLFGQHNPRRPALAVDDLAVDDLVLHLADGMGALGIGADAQLRLLCHLDLGDQAAGRGIPAREPDSGCLANQAARPVTADEVLRPQRLAVGELYHDASVVLCEPRHLAFAVDRHLELGDPTRQDALEIVLPQSQPVVVAGRGSR